MRFYIDNINKQFSNLESNLNPYLDVYINYYKQ